MKFPQNGIIKLYVIRQFNAIMPPLCVTNEMATAFCASVCVDLSTRSSLESRLLPEDRLYCSVICAAGEPAALLFKLYDWSNYDLNHRFQCYPDPGRAHDFPRSELGGPA